MKSCVIILLTLIPIVSRGQTDTLKINSDLIKKYSDRISLIGHSGILLNNYSFFIDEIIKTQCTKIKEGLLMHYVNKWKELLYDYEELSKINSLIEVDVNSKTFNYSIAQIKKEIELTKDIILIKRDTNVNYKDPVQSKDYLEKIKLAAQRINNINTLTINFKSL